MMIAPLTCFTYSLGKSLYVPLTSRSNALTLPESRGPHFLLPASVVAALCNVRDEESQSNEWSHWCKQDVRQKLPNAQETLPRLESGDKAICNDNDNLEDGLFPTVEAIFNEIQSQTKSDKFMSLVFAGEGEPTLRTRALLSLAKRIRESGIELPLRLATNGIVHDKALAEKLLSSGISSVSVALQTNDPALYNIIMKPNLDAHCASETTITAHALVCEFIQNSVRVGLEVETTGVSRPDVDQKQTEALASRLGVIKPFRWRTYFP